MKQENKDLLFAGLRLLLVVVVLGGIGLLLFRCCASKESLLAFVDRAGFFGPLIIIMLTVLEVVVAPLPGPLFVLLSGYLFGPWWGAFYSYVGNILGSALAFGLARWFGKPLVLRLVKESSLQRYNHYLDRGWKWVMVWYVFPVIPIDILSFVCGLSDMRWKRFWFIIIVGYIPHILIVAMFGDWLHSFAWWQSLLFVVGLLVVFALLSFGIPKLVERHRKMKKHI